MNSRSVLLGVVVLVASDGLLTAGQNDVRFSRDIQPILAANCLQCHGADEHKREGGLRLDTFDGATAIHEGKAAVVPGNVDASELMRRIRSTDPDVQMPPRDSGKSLTVVQVELLRSWIQQGGEYQQHWAFLPPERPPVPKSETGTSWVKNPVDAFVYDRLQTESLQPSTAASPLQLLRRAYLDVIGLPPTEEQIAAFEAKLDQGRLSDDVWRETVDDLLASPHYGEKWARHWLDAARYSDSDGFEKDKPRFVWFYRDWVVRSLNNDKPYDQFLQEQLAGDLMPGRTQDQLVATGFLRNSMINEEGGVDPEQFRMEAMFDRMDAVGKAMLGLTIQCTQCHNHKYDPFTQQEYYQLFSLLNNCDEAQATVYTEAEQTKRTQILNDVAAIEQSLKESHPEWSTSLTSWLNTMPAQSGNWTIMRPELDASGGQKHYLLDDGSILAQGYAPTKHTTEFTADTDLKSLTGFRIELLNDANLPHGGPGRSVDGLCALSEFQVVVTNKSTGKSQNVKLKSATAGVNPAERELAAIYGDKSKDRRVTGPVSYAMDGNNLTAWGIDVGGGRSNVPRNAVFVPESPMISDAGFRVTFKLVQMHGGWNSDDNQNNNLGRFRLSVTSDAEPAADLIPAGVRKLAGARDSLRRANLETAFSVWRTTVPEFADANQKIEALWQQHPQGTTQLVLSERVKPRATYLLTRGDFLKPADQVTSGIPEVLNSDHAAIPSNRLELAQWMTRPAAPTTARAIVNRLWQEYFGIGIVRTAEDLGTQGEYPSHPELLDWLAVELREHRWSLKHIHRLILTSATWRQSSVVSAELLARDPENRLLARGPRQRVSGEGVRDIFLTASGLLNRDMGGPSVYPPAPEFLFQPPASYGPKTWALETGANRYRRALYTFRFRSVPYPVLQNFDTPRGDVACVRRTRSNTPLQALTTLNEELFMECSRALGAELAKADGDDATKIQTLMRRCVTRQASQVELGKMRAFLEAQRARFATDAKAAAELAGLLPPQEDSGVRESSAKPNVASQAAWTALARVVLNLDETITKE